MTLSDTLAALSAAATQEDRDAAASYGRSVGILTRGEVAAMINGHNDDCTVVQAFAAHRRNVITEALRTGQLVPVPSVEDTVRRVGEIVFQLTRFACGQQLERGRKLMSTHPFFEKHPEWWKHFDQLIDGLSLNISELVFDQKWLDEASHAVIAAMQEGRDG